MIVSSMKATSIYAWLAKQYPGITSPVPGGSDKGASRKHDKRHLHFKFGWGLECGYGSCLLRTNCLAQLAGYQRESFQQTLTECTADIWSHGLWQGAEKLLTRSRKWPLMAARSIEVPCRFIKRSCNLCTFSQLVLDIFFHKVFCTRITICKEGMQDSPIWQLLNSS
jgi:hypothetical protein